MLHFVCGLNWLKLWEMNSQRQPPSKDVESQSPMVSCSFEPHMAPSWTYWGRPPSGWKQRTSPLSVFSLPPFSQVMQRKTPKGRTACSPRRTKLEAKPGYSPNKLKFPAFEIPCPPINIPSPSSLWASQMLGRICLKIIWAPGLTSIWIVVPLRVQYSWQKEQSNHSNSNKGQSPNKGFQNCLPTRNLESKLIHRATFILQRGP